MQLKNEISEELGLLSMVVAGIDRRLPYEAPEGYFEGFPEKMLGLLGNEQADGALSPEPPAWGKGTTFSVPTGYFEGFASRMLDRIKSRANEPLVRPKAGAGQGESPIDAQKALADNGWSDLSGDPYRELAELSPLLSRMDKRMPFGVPEGYFDALTTDLAEMQAENLSPLMTSLKGITVYETPDGYFETLPEIMTARVRPAEKQQAKIISMSRVRKTWFKYSAAAVVAGFIFTIGWLRLHTPGNRQGPNSVDVAQGLTRVSDQDIDTYLDNHSVQVQQDDPLDNSMASLDISDNDVRSFLGDVPDGDLSQYMEEHGDIKDYPTN